MYKKHNTLERPSRAVTVIAGTSSRFKRIKMETSILKRDGKEEAAGKLLVIKDLLSKKDYKTFLKDLADLTLLKEAALDTLKYPVKLVIEGGKWSDFGPYGTGYWVILGGPSTTWSVATGFCLQYREEITRALSQFIKTVN
jgi:hypothetical protein